VLDVDGFTDEQKQFLSLIVSDFGGPTASPALLSIIENLLYTLKPDWELSSFSDERELRSDIEVCMAALSYWKVHNVVERR
jgi:hypothetical protein